MSEGMSEREVRYGGVAEFDQLLAGILDAIRDSFCVYVVTASQNGGFQTFSLIPQPENERQRRWLEEFITATEEGVEELRSVMDE